MGEGPEDSRATADPTEQVEAPPPGGATDQGKAPAGEEPAAPSGFDAFPPDTEGFRARHPDALKLELALGGLVVAAAVFLSFAGALAIVLFAGLPAGAKALALVVAFAIPTVLAFAGLWLPRLQHQRYRYRVSAEGLEIRQGVWWRSHRLIPRTRLQHTDVAQGPLERRFELASLVVHTAGTHAAQTTVSGLSMETALELRALLTPASDDESDGV